MPRNQPHAPRRRRCRPTRYIVAELATATLSHAIPKPLTADLADGHISPTSAQRHQRRSTIDPAQGKLPSSNS